ncbi:MAG: hypothetical protein HY301_19945 [Verrucomicrobia bacterium]|nr:hypothetical protein [Verrucomicrobiota bacterium]
MMHLRSIHRRCRAAGFTVLEMLVAVTILVFIIFGLWAMFNQTQRAFRAGATQVDVLEGGRAAMEIVTRELEQLTTSHLATFTNFYVATNSGSGLVVTNIVDSTVFNNQLNEVFVLTGDTRKWKGVGYFVDYANSNVVDFNLRSAGVGSLYRWSTNVTTLSTSPASAGNLVAAFNAPGGPRFQRVIDGVVAFQVKAYNSGGILITNDAEYAYPPKGTIAAARSTDELPAWLELELAVLEPEVLARARALPTSALMQNYLQTEVARIHVFRQKISIRNAPR